MAITGASGGVGASSLSCALSVRLARARPGGVLIDGDLTGGGLDVTAALDDQPGYRWADLARLEGAADADAIVAGLPTGAFALLSAGAGPGDGQQSGARVPPDEAVDSVCRAVSQRASWLVVDLPRSQIPLWHTKIGVHAVVVEVSPRGLRDAEQVLGRLADRSAASGAADGLDSVVLVTRGGRHAGEVSEALAWHLDIPVIAHCADDASVPRDAERGRCVGAGSGPLTAAAGAIERFIRLTGDEEPVRRHAS